MAHAGVEHDEHFVLRTGLYPLTKSAEEDGVVFLILVGVHLAQFIVGQIFVDVYGWLAPV